MNKYSLLPLKLKFNHILFCSVLLFLLNNSSYAQTTTPCLFDSVIAKNRHAVNDADKIIMQKLHDNAISNNLKTISFHRVIPVVVHVIHNGGTENISDAQIQSQIDVLNEDYRKIVGTNGFGNGVDTEIEFCLAKIDPNGKCTNGIVRVQSTLTNHQSYQRAQLSALSYWDNTRYLNMYVVKTIAGNVIGYSSYPNGPASDDGVVCIHNYFGRTGTASASLGRTMSHESGHWFGLYHTFNGGCGVDTCADGDYVCDTPPAANPNFGCPVINSCSNDLPNVNDQVQNYMDYSNDACKNMFSLGQKLRMQATLDTIRTNIWSAANVTSTGCDSGFTNVPCNVIAAFTANSQNICTGNSVLFTNISQNNPITYQWYFPGGTPASATTANVTVSYNTPGTFDVTLITTNAVGNDSITLAGYMHVNNPPVGIALPYMENFEDTIFPTNGIIIDNPDNGITWERDTVAVHFSGMGSAKINNLININYGQSDAMLLPAYDMTTLGTSPRLFFRWAWARSDPNYTDELFVLISTDCGVNYTQLFTRSGAALATGPTQTTPYIPDSTTVWKLANINLAPYITYSNAIIKIVNVTDGGNNLYIDSLHINTIATSIDENSFSSTDFSVYPNPSSDFVTIKFRNSFGDKVTISLTDLSGRKIKQWNLMNAPDKIHIPLSDILSGCYLLNISSNRISQTEKLFITNN
ncbi:MAG: M43 family zinc metalloprotease [Bacteroidia bacterium]